VARGLEAEGYPTVMLSWDDKRLALVNPPRSAISGLRGATVGQPGDAAGQRRVLELALGLLEREAPLEPLFLKERE
jgi:hypothetical protein